MKIPTLLLPSLSLLTLPSSSQDLAAAPAGTESAAAVAPGTPSPEQDGSAGGGVSPSFQQPQLPGLLEPGAAGLTVPAPTPTAVVATATPAEAQAPEPQLPPAEIHVRKGISLLLKLHSVLAEINSPQSAEKAVTPLVTLSRDLLKWTQGFASLPPLDDDTRILYEDQYLPIFRKVNTQLKLQGERLASAKYYGSRDLPTALAHLILTLQ